MDDVQPRAGRTRVGDVTLGWRAWGPEAGARPPLLLIHGLASAARIWDLVAPLLARDRRVVALDQRGHGASDKPDDGYSTARIVADDQALAAALGLPRPVIVGHSWGAAIALAWAASAPESVSGLVLVDGGVTDLQSRPGATRETIERELQPPDFAGTPRAAFLARLREREDLPWRPEFEEIILNIVELRADDTVGPRLTWPRHRAILRALWEFRPTEHYPRVTCPVLVVLADSAAGHQRARDFALAKQRGADAALLGLTNARSRRVVWLSETAHDIPLHRPAELAALIDGLVD